MSSLVRVYPTRSAAANAAAAQFVAAAEKAIATHGRFSVALSGGNTPRDVYRLLASDEYAPMVDWDRTHVFWGDERAVPLNDAENNGRMARETLLSHVQIPPNNVHRIQSQLPPEDAAKDYEKTLRDFFGGRGEKAPNFDLLLLGLGAEGHTASLFPGNKALQEKERWVVATYVEQVKMWRITLTPPALNAAAKVMFLVAGEEKAQIVKQILSEPKQPDLYPAQIIDPPDGQVFWVLDKPAAALYEQK
ncbi:MAG TPA: 6-phosphogluconolactonase [Phototrophicaceae bacterium]|nr:6-phosphogluconolactonase [Phototrophicaceae bacterium]